MLEIIKIAELWLSRASTLDEFFSGGAKDILRSIGDNHANTAKRAIGDGERNIVIIGHLRGAYEAYISAANDWGGIGGIIKTYLTGPHDRKNNFEKAAEMALLLAVVYMKENDKRQAKLFHERALGAFESYASAFLVLSSNANRTATNAYRGPDPNDKRQIENERNAIKAISKKL